MRVAVTIVVVGGRLRLADDDQATVGRAKHLDGQYSAFGQIVEGIEVLALFEKEEVDGETPKRRLEIIEASIDP